MRRRGAWALAFLAAGGGAALVGGCGKGDDGTPGEAACTAGTVECLGEASVRECPDDGSEWIVYSCPAGEACTEGVGCGGGCDALGAAECVDDNVVRVCDGTRWVTSVCDAGQTCDEGACVTPNAPVCTPSAQECLTATTLLVCAADGSGWHEVPCGAGGCANGDCGTAGCTPDEVSCASAVVRQVCRSDGAGYDEWPCPTGQVCDDGACVFDMGRHCTPRVTECFGNSLFTCVDDGTGWGRDDCPAGTQCDAVAGACMGSVCAPHATKCEAGSLFTCADDGGSWLVTSCVLPEACQTLAGAARCTEELPPCTLGEVECGDAASGGGLTTSFSRCEALPDADFGRGWVLHVCDAPLSCDPAAPGCTQDCVPGSTRCNEDGVETCSATGEWSGDVEPCVGTTVCSTRIPGAAGAVCASVACDALAAAELAYFTVSYADDGVCSNGAIRLCDESGQLSAATPCAAGECSGEGYPYSALDYALGTCSDVRDCVAGEQQCLAGSTQLYRSCDAGSWSTAYEACSAGTCTTVTNDGLREVRCGTGACAPGATQCVGDQIQTCGASGTWAVAEDCGSGVCRHPTGYDQPVCIDECLPDELFCGGASAAAADGYHAGLSHAGTCANGRIPTFAEGMTACPATTTCRTSINGAALGCVECVGPDLGGNEQGLVDTRCSADATGTQACNAANAWGSAVVCSDEQMCVPDGPGVTCREGVVFPFGATFPAAFTSPRTVTEQAWVTATTLTVTPGSTTPRYGSHMLIARPTAGGTASVELTLDFPDGGSLSFDLDPTLQDPFGNGTTRFLIDGAIEDTWYDGSVGGWSHVTYPVEAGSHTFTWLSTQQSGGYGSAIDEVVALGAVAP